MIQILKNVGTKDMKITNMNRRNFLKTAATGLGSISVFPLLNGKESTHTPPHSNAVDWINCNIKRYDPVRGNVPLKLNDEQINFIHYIELNDESLLLKYQQRQSGYTTATAAYLLYRMIHDTNSNFSIICSNENQRGNVMDIISGMYNHLPNQMSVVKSYMRDRHTMDINSNRLSIKSINTNGKGFTSNLVFLQDYGFYQDKDTVIRSVQYTLAPGNSKIVGYSYIG